MASIITKNEFLASLNAPETYVLAMVEVEQGVAKEPTYVRKFFASELGFAETAVVFDIGDLRSIGGRPAYPRITDAFCKYLMHSANP